MKRHLPNPSQFLVLGVTGRSELGYNEEIHYWPGQGDEDPCYDVERLREFNLAEQCCPWIFELRPWARTELWWEAA